MRSVATAIVPVTSGPSRRARWGLAWALLGVWLWAGSPAMAQEVAFDLSGHLRYRNVFLGDFPVDDMGTEHGQDMRGLLRLRVIPELRFSKRFYLKADVQLLGGQVYGRESRLGQGAVQEPWRARAFIDHFRLREAYLQVPILIGVARAGRMASHWGLGILANGGGREDYAFADATHGDLVNRIAVILKPFAFSGLGRVGEALRFAMAADIVESDDLASREDGDWGWQVVGSLYWAEPALRAGLYVTYRDVTGATEDRTEVVSTDLFLRWEGGFADRFFYRLEMEAALVTGQSTAAGTDGAPEVLDVMQYGGVVRGQIRDEGTALGLTLEGGFASGDDDPTDGTLGGFRFDPGYKAGMILFEEIMGRVTANSHDRVAAMGGDTPAHRAADPVATNGAITGAAYLYPQIGWRGCDGCFNARMGLLVAWTTADLIDAYQSTHSGGGTSGPYGASKSRGTLGYELNAGCGVGVDVADAAQVNIGAQFGLFLPGEALEAADGVAGLGVVHKVRLTTDVRW